MKTRAATIGNLVFCGIKIMEYILLKTNTHCLRAFGQFVYDTEKISMAPALRMTRIIKEKLPIFLFPGSSPP